jgi:hypothetical protein
LQRVAMIKMMVLELYTPRCRLKVVRKEMNELSKASCLAYGTLPYLKLPIFESYHITVDSGSSSLGRASGVATTVSTPRSSVVCLFR